MDGSGLIQTWTKLLRRQLDNSVARERVPQLTGALTGAEEKSDGGTNADTDSQAPTIAMSLRTGLIMP